jgi:DNA-binding MarR family transcriptional regulator
MAWNGGGSASSKRVRNGKKVHGGEDFLRLLRDSHIFASAICEILDVKLLQEVSPCALTPSQFQILKLMSNNGHHQVGEVAGFLGVSAPAATKNIDKLERLGLMVRSPSKGDRRATLLSVSRKGRRLVQKYEELRAVRLAPVMEAFKPSEIEALTGLLQRFSVSLLSHEPIGKRFCLRCAGYIEDDCPIRQVHGGCRYQEILGTRHGSSGTAEEA